MANLCKNCNEKLKDGSKFCGHCGAQAGEIQTAETAKTDVALPFLVDPTKVAVLSILSFGLYDIYWFVKHWRYVKSRDEAKIRPFWRGLFSVLFCLPLFRKLGIAQPINRALIYIAFSLAGRLPDNWFLLSFFSVVALFQVQQELNLQHSAGQLSGYSKKETAVAVLGGLFWALVIWSFTQV